MPSWKADWVLGLALALGFLFASNSDLLQSLERKAYDLAAQAASRQPSDKVAVIAIDEQSIANLGRWPWPRDIHARMIDLLAGAGAKAIGHTVLFLEPQVDPGLAYVNRMIQFYDGSALKSAPGPLQQDSVALDALLHEAEQRLNTDRKLAASIQQAGNVELAMLFQ